MNHTADHILLTRFNLPSEGVESTIRDQGGWLEGRVQLFEKYCLPSVRAQRDCPPSWIIYFDPESPGWLKSWIDATCRDTFLPLFRAKVDRSDLLEDIDGVFPRKSDALITSNLDNDDGLGLDFAARLQSHLCPNPRTAIYFCHGLIKSKSGLFLRTDRANAFCSVRETWDDPVTCWTDWHNRLHRRMPVDVVAGAPQWLQVIHDTNVSNRVRGRLVSPHSYTRDFVGIEEMDVPMRRDVWLDRMVYMPGRTARDGMRTTARRALVGALGKDGVNRLKARMARAERPGAVGMDDSREESSHE